MTPQRIQLSRRKGWRKPPNTVVVSRPSEFGNHFAVGGLTQSGLLIKTKSMAAQEFGRWLHNTPEGLAMQRKAQHELRGKNLACWCGPEDDCHADHLLKVANS